MKPGPGTMGTVSRESPFSASAAKGFSQTAAVNASDGLETITDNGPVGTRSNLTSTWSSFFSTIFPSSPSSAPLTSPSASSPFSSSSPTTTASNTGTFSQWLAGERSTQATEANGNESSYSTWGGLLDGGSAGELADNGGSGSGFISSSGVGGVGGGGGSSGGVRYIIDHNTSTADHGLQFTHHLSNLSHSAATTSHIGSRTANKTATATTLHVSTETTTSSPTPPSLASNSSSSHRQWITESEDLYWNATDYAPGSEHIRESSFWENITSTGPPLPKQTRQWGQGKGGTSVIYDWLNSSGSVDYYTSSVTGNDTTITAVYPNYTTDYNNLSTAGRPQTTTTLLPAIWDSITNHTNVSSSLSSSTTTTPLSNLTSFFSTSLSTSLVENSTNVGAKMETTIPCEGIICIDFYHEISYNFTNSSLGAGEEGNKNETNWEVLLLLIVVFAGVMGNVLVCIAVSLEKKLQNITNYFLMSLAVADLFVSLVVMPCSIVHEFMGYWPFGLAVCDLWQVADVMMCTSSIMHMCTISLDRYSGIRNPLKTRSKSHSNVAIKIAVVWVISLALASPIILLGVLNPENVLSGGICAIFNHYFLIYGSLAAFFIPLLIMFIAYSLTIHLLHKQAKRCSKRHQKDMPLMRRSTSCRKKDSRSAARSNEQRTISRMQNANGLHMAHKLQNHLNLTSDRELLQEDRCESETNQLLPKRLDSREGSESPSRTPRLQLLVKKHGAAIRAASYMIQKKEERREMHSVKTEQKAVKVLGTMFAIFVICWAPFFSLNFAMGVCESCEIDVSLFKVFLWLGYVSSTLNPIIYTIFNKTFKKTFIKILTCRLKTKRKIHKSGTYTTNNGTSIRVRYETTNESAV